MRNEKTGLSALMMQARWIIGLLVCRMAAGAEAPAPPAAGADDLFQIGQKLFDQLAPPEVKAQFEFPSKQQWDAFAGRLQQALDDDSLDALAAYEPEARTSLTTLRSLPGYEDYADWLEQRLDEISGARESLAPPLPSPPPGAPGARGPSLQPAIPHYDLWAARVRGRPVPARALSLMPRLRAAFVAEGVPPELAWLAEAESTFNPVARSPAGARGLFQFMPATAQSLGLSTTLPDDRTDPEKSAHAAARYLRQLYAKFGSWPLALAAYNAGEGRLSRTLTARRVTDFAGVAPGLPAETRMYVPKVCALVALRTGVTPDKLPPPRL